MKTIFFLLGLLISLSIFSQTPSSYLDEKGKTHLCGPFDISTLESDTNYNTWFNEYYKAFKTSDNTKWKSELENVKVEIFLGTWCGDSKYWVSNFIKLWDDLGLNRDQLEFTGLYYLDDKIKVGPNGEEKGKYIHRVPTFIFTKDTVEIARIVESPVTDLETDVAQIALGVPSKPNYRAANFLMRFISEQNVEDLNKQKDQILRMTKYFTKQSKELNTLAYVMSARGDIEKSLFLLEMNCEIFPFEPNVYDSYGEILIKGNQKELAIKQFKKVLQLDPENESAKQQLLKLKS